jgi:hypothetical protein
MTALAYSTVQDNIDRFDLFWKSRDRGRHSEIDVIVDRGGGRRLIGDEEERRVELLCFRHEPSINDTFRPDRGALLLA